MKTGKITIGRKEEKDPLVVQYSTTYVLIIEKDYYVLIECKVEGRIFNVLLYRSTMGTAQNMV